MAIHHETGTANNYKDLLFRLTKFATTSSVLTTAGIAWQPERSTYITDTSRTPELYIGASKKDTVTGDFLAGTIDETAIYNSELSASQVSANYALISANNGANYYNTVLALATNYYRHDDTSGAIATDSKGADNGRYEGTVTRSQTGIFGAGGGSANNNAVLLDGTSGYISLDSAFTAGFGNQEKTVEFSFKTSDQNGCLACFKQNKEWYGFFIESGNLIFRSSTFENDSTLAIASTVADGTYKHFVFARDAQGHFKVYLNGALVYTYAPTVHEVALKGVGNGGLDEIYIAFQTEEDISSGWYNINLNGYSGYVRTGDFYTQPIALPNDQYLPALMSWNVAIPYDFMVSGRSIKIASRVSTNDELAYVGLLKNYGLPAENPYPLVVAGSFYRGQIYSSTNNSHANFFNPIDDALYNSKSHVKINIGGWISVYNSNGQFTIPVNQTITNPYCNYGAMQQNLYNLDTETKPLLPVDIIKYTSTVYGIFEDCYYTSYTNQSSTDTITEGAEVYKIFQNCHRVGRNDFVAIRIV